MAKKSTKKKVLKKVLKKEVEVPEVEEEEVKKIDQEDHTKPIKKEAAPRVRKPKREKIDSMELLYKLIHSVQVLKKEASLTIEDESLKPIVINILKDSEVDYQVNVFHGTKTLIRLVPNSESFENDIDLEEIDKDFIFDITGL